LLKREVCVSVECMIISSVALFKKALPQKGPLMGLDVGAKTYGLSLSDALWCVASPYKTLRRVKWSHDAPLLKALWCENKIVGLVVGWPLMMNGQEGSRCHAVRHCVENLMQLEDLPCLLWDERLSTRASLALLEGKADLSRQKRGMVVDAVASAWILGGALEGLRREGGALPENTP